VHKKGVETLKELQEKIIRLGTVPFYGLMFGIYVIGVILGNIILGDYGWLGGGLAGAYIGWTVMDRIQAS
jgi:hypothetical protein